MVHLGIVLLVKLNGAEEWLPAHLRFVPEGWWNWPLEYSIELEVKMFSDLSTLHSIFNDSYFLFIFTVDCKQRKSEMRFLFTFEKIKSLLNG